VPTCYRHPDRETYIRCQRCDRPICPDCMRDASVGFQCPSCVSEGRKETRSGRAPYGGAQAASYGLVSKILIAINGAIWILIAAGGFSSSTLVDKLALIPRGRCDAADGGYYPGIHTAAACDSARVGAHWVDGVATGAPYELLTSVFTHVEVWHIGFNMLALWILGPQLELLLGWVRFLGLYLLSGLVGSAVVYWLSDPAAPTLGASGAIFGLMGALLVLAFKVRTDVNQLLMWIGINFAITFFGRGFISWQGHVGGFLGGIALGAVIAYPPRERRTAWQAAGFSLVTVAVVVAVVLRTAALT
jgi:membrane associated rhomboid family serine protease